MNSHEGADDLRVRALVFVFVGHEEQEGVHA